MKFLNLGEQNCVSEILPGLLGLGREKGKVSLTPPAPEPWQTQGREGALLYFSFAFTQGVGCALTSSFWAWREQEEQKQRGDGLSTQLN